MCRHIPLDLLEGRMKKNIGQIDLETGELLVDYVAYVLPKRKNGFGVGGWSAMANHAYAILKTFKKVEDFRVLMALLERLEFDNLILVNQSEIARELEMLQPNVSAAIKRLVEVGVILKGPKKGSGCSYKLNPNFGWKGSAKGHVKALDEYRTERAKKGDGEPPAEKR